MENFKTLIVIIPVDENLDKVLEYTSRLSYKKEFWHSFAPPHKISYEFVGLSDTGVEHIKNAFREIFKDSKYKHACRFEMKGSE